MDVDVKILEMKKGGGRSPRLFVYLPDQVVREFDLKKGDFFQVRYPMKFNGDSCLVLIPFEDDRSESTLYHPYKSWK